MGMNFRAGMALAPYFLLLTFVAVGMAAAPDQKLISKEQRRKLANDVLPPPPGQRLFQQGWPVGSRIPVYFKNGKAARKTEVMNCANEWTRHGNFQFQWNTGPMPQGIHAIHIEFHDGPGVSRLGGGSYGPEYSSMRLPRSEFQDGDCTTTLHEFGHALGLYHEFENPDSLKHLQPVNMQTYQKLEDTYGWSKEEADLKLIKRVVPAQAQKPFDPYSIMGYASIAAMTGLYGDLEMQTGPDLSEGDKAYIARMYPGRRNPPVESTVTFVDPPDMIPEEFKTVRWPQKNITFRIPRSFKVKSMDAAKVVVSNPAGTWQAVLQDGVIQYDQMVPAAASTRQTPDGQTTFAGHTFYGSGSESADFSMNYVVVLAAGTTSGKAAPWRIRSISWKFGDGRSFHGMMMHLEHDMLKEQMDEFAISVVKPQK